MITVLFQNSRCLYSFKDSLLAEVSHDAAKMRERGVSPLSLIQCLVVRDLC